MEYVDILKQLIRAACSGNWSLHLGTVGRMMNIFGATGHMHYAKSAQLYLQTMLKLPTKGPWVYTSFEEHWYHLFVVVIDLG